MRGGAVVARLFHRQKVADSNSAPATNSFISLSLKINRGLNGGFLLNINYRSDAVVVELEDTLVLEASA